MAERFTWGADTPISMPVPMEGLDFAKADMDGFCFTPDGLRLDMSAADYEDLISHGYGPQDGGPPDA